MNLVLEYNWIYCEIVCLQYSSVLAHFMLKERLQRLGVLGCLSCIVGSVVIVIHAPEEHSPTSVQEIWELATQPGKNYKLSSPSLFHSLTALALSLKYTHKDQGIEIQSICQKFYILQYRPYATRYHI